MPRLVQSNVAGSLAALVALLRAVYQTHQASHWQTRAQTYYGDHLLFQKLYEATLPEIDQVAERAIGSGGIAMLDPVKQSSQTTDFIAAFRGRRGATPSPTQLVEISLGAEMALLQGIDEVLSTRGISQGTQNLLQGIADVHEGHVYLLQQRLAQG